MAQKPVLGKGLASLLPGAAVVAGATTAPSAAATPASAGAAPVAPMGTGAVSATTTIGNQERLAGIALLPIEDLELNAYQQIGRAHV